MYGVGVDERSLCYNIFRLSKYRFELYRLALNQTMLFDRIYIILKCIIVTLVFSIYIVSLYYERAGLFFFEMLFVSHRINKESI